MDIRPISRALIVAVGAASMAAAVGGCTSTKMMSAPQPTTSIKPPKKEYQWKDMSTGRSFFRPIEKDTGD